MNFFEHQAQARKQSRWLIILFMLAVLAIVAAINLVVLVVLGFVSWDPQQAPGTFTDTIGSHLPLMLTATLGSIAVIGLASLFKTAGLRSGGGQVARQLGATLVDADTRDPLRRRLRNVVEEIALASGVPVPEIYVMDQESGINAFAAGYTPADAAVAVTRGALEKLNRNELQGVIAHEFSHILNGDMRINIRLMGTLFGILVLALIGRRVLIHSHLAGRGTRDKNAAVILAIAFSLMAVGYIGLFFGRWIKAAVSRQREYLADASAVQFTRDPDSIGGALKKIAVYSEASYLNADTEEVSHMLFGDGRKMFLFSTHPPLNARIARVDPGFQPEDLARMAAKIQHDRLKEEKQAAAKEKAAKAQPGMFDAGGMIDDIGKPDWERMLMAAAIVASLPDNISRAARSSQWAPDVLFYTLLDGRDDIRQQQLLAIAQRMGAESEERVRALVDAAGLPSAEQRLPLMELAFPALRQRPPDFLTRVLDTIKAVADADGRIDVFEYLLSRSISQQLWEAHNPHKVELAGKLKLETVERDTQKLLAIIARHGHADQAEAQAAYTAGLKEIELGTDTALPELSDWVSGLDTALSRLDRLKPTEKERLVRGMAAVVLHDGQLDPAELELLRAASELLHVPLPMLSAGQHAV